MNLLFQKLSTCRGNNYDLLQHFDISSQYLGHLQILPTKTEQNVLHSGDSPLYQ